MHPAPEKTYLKSTAGVEPAISRLAVGRDIHFATQTYTLIIVLVPPFLVSLKLREKVEKRSDRDSNSDYRSQNPV